MSWRCRFFGHTWAKLDPERGICSSKQCVVCGERWALKPWPPPPPPPPPEPPGTWTSVTFTHKPDGSTAVRRTVHGPVRLRVVPNPAPAERDPAEEAARRGVLL